MTVLFIVFQSQLYVLCVFSHCISSANGPHMSISAEISTLLSDLWSNCVVSPQGGAMSRSRLFPVDEGKVHPEGHLSQVSSRRNLRLSAKVNSLRIKWRCWAEVSERALDLDLTSSQVVCMGEKKTTHAHYSLSEIQVANILIQTWQWFSSFRLNVFTSWQLLCDPVSLLWLFIFALCKLALVYSCFSCLGP